MIFWDKKSANPSSAGKVHDLAGQEKSMSLLDKKSANPSSAGKVHEFVGFLRLALFFRAISS
ncbi:hypothetical protein [uncultured Anaerobiospirillum sp.]|uniref:hypothetical protein n=1 Tax=uncultured Anaerobiospirillum sp. TaxID=265728 RepID=UPI0028042F40|nr:hypothetical protein [uncultured Anaerobiospirillum sp.]